MLEDNINSPVTRIERGKIVKNLLVGLPKKGLVYIKLKNPKRTAGLVVRSYGDRPFLTPNGGQRKFIFEKNLKLDMEKEEDRLLYGQLIHHPKFKGVFDIENKEEEAVDLLEFKKLESKAGTIIFDMKEEDVRDFCRILLIPGASNSSPTVLRKALFDKVAENAGDFLMEWDDSDKPYKILLRRCMDSGICVKKQGRFMLNQTGIGTTFEMGIEWLKANEDLLPELRKQNLDKI